MLTRTLTAGTTSAVAVVAALAMGAAPAHATHPLAHSAVDGTQPHAVAGNPLEIDEKTAPTFGWALNNALGAPTLTYFSQSDRQWERATSYNFPGCGCGSTSMAMVISTLTDDSTYTPASAYQEQRKAGGINGNCGTINGPEVFTQMGRAHGLVAVPIKNDMDAARSILQRGGLVTASITGGTAFYPLWESHYVVIRGLGKDGKFLIADPVRSWGEKNSQRGWRANDFVFNMGMVGFLPAENAQPPVPAD